MATSTNLSPEELGKILFPEGRHTQDSPVFSDVWFAYADLANEKRPNDRVDLLLNPHRDSSPAELCRWLCDRLECRAEIERRKNIKTKKPREGFGLAVSESHVVVRLSLGELVRVALPLTNWWLFYLWEARKSLDAGDAEREPYERASLRITEFEEPANRAFLAQQLSVFIQQASRRDTATTSARLKRDEATIPGDLLWMVWIVGRISLATRRSKAEPNAKQLVAEVYKLVKEMDTITFPHEPVLWSVSRNRPAGLSTSKSARTIKADAAGRVFDLSCNRLTWAVLDSGIDATHPAFAKRSRSGDPQDERPFVVKRKRLLNNTRIEATYDFTRLRDLLSIDISDDPEELGKVTAADRQRVQELRRGLRQGRMIEWDTLARELKVDIDPEDPTPGPDDERTYEDWLQSWYRRPRNEHGTHVAGILGGDWPEEKLQGVCRDITLYDLRVLDDRGQGDEYSVLAALQFIRYVNAGKDQPAIHGANVSISICHDVVNYACGRTPVCDESARLVASGVVVVAAAGNQGVAKYVVAGQTLPQDGYRSISITDPGNAEAVITVGATHRQHPHTYGVSYFSSRGPTGDGRSKPDLVAPGEKITAPVPGNKSKSLDGTSMAAPHVSGAAALLMARYPEFKGEPQRIKQILCETATDLGRERYFQGHGMVDVLRALQSV